MTRPTVNLRWKPLHRDFVVPKQATAGAAGLDMIACIEEPVVLRPGERAAISLGCAVEIPEGWELQVRPRSGLALKQGLTVLNAPGTIDSDYRGEVKVILINHDTQQNTIRPLDRVCQLVPAQVPLVVSTLADDLSDTERGQGGFGSTGTK
jgi:dUTP pyrophosphatase